MPMEIWLRILLDFVSAPILVTLLITVLEQNQPVWLCLAAYGALPVVVWSGVDLLTSFAELHHELQNFPDSSHISYQTIGGAHPGSGQIRYSSGCS